MLEILSLSTGYGAIEVVSQASIVVEPGTMVTLIGPNGAGKSTLLNAVSGFLKPRSGSIHFDGHAIDGLPPYRIAQAGLIQVPEGRQILGPLTVEENLELGRLATGSRAAANGDELDRVFSLFPVLAERRRQRGDELSGGQQQMLAIGRGLMGRPRILMLDEPSLGLAPLVVSQVFAALKALNGEGLSILLVEQNARRALECTSYGYVLEQGRIVHQGASAELARDPKIIEHYLGRHHGSAIAVSSRSGNPSPPSIPYASRQ